jgi:hypothetical protein
MEWEFTPEQVMKGEVGYRLADFRRDLRREVELNLPGLGDQQTERMFSLVYDLCYWLTTGKEFDEFEALYADTPLTQLFLRSVPAHGGGNVEMLGAILQRLIMDRIEAGMSLEQAIDAVAEHHWRTIDPDGVAASLACRDATCACGTTP